MIKVDMTHDVRTGKAVGLMVVLGIAVGATTVITKEILEQSKNKIKKIKDNNGNK